MLATGQSEGIIVYLRHDITGQTKCVCPEERSGEFCELSNFKVNHANVAVLSVCAFVLFGFIVLSKSRAAAEF